MPFGAGAHFYLLGVGFEKKVERKKHILVIVYNQYFSKLFLHNQSVSAAKITYNIRVLCVRFRTIFVR